MLAPVNECTTYDACSQHSSIPRTDPSCTRLLSDVDRTTTYTSVEGLSIHLMHWRSHFRGRINTYGGHTSHPATFTQPTLDVYCFISGNDPRIVRLNWRHIHAHPQMRSTRGTGGHNLDTHTERQWTKYSLQIVLTRSCIGIPPPVSNCCLAHVWIAI